MATDLSAFFLKETGAVEIDLPNGDSWMFDGKRVTAHVFGPGTDEYIKAADALDKYANQNMRRILDPKKHKDPKDKEADAKFLAGITEKIEPFPDAPFEIYRNPHLSYVCDQVRAYIGDKANFFETGTTS